MEKKTWQRPVTFEYLSIRQEQKPNRVKKKTTSQRGGKQLFCTCHTYKPRLYGILSPQTALNAKKKLKIPKIPSAEPLFIVCWLISAPWLFVKGKATEPICLGSLKGDNSTCGHQ